MATEFRTVKSTGLDAESISIGNVNSFGTTALSVLESPVIHLDSDHEMSMYYGDMMGSDVSLFAGGWIHKLTPKLSLGLGVVNEDISAGYETASANGQVTVVDTLSYRTTEYVINMSYKTADTVTLGLSAQYIDRDVFNVQANTMSLSAGCRYETDLIGLTLGGKNINSPTVTYSNDATETLYAEFYAGIKSTLVTFVPVTLYGQYNWVPAESVGYYGAGLSIPFATNLSINGGYMQVRDIGSNINEQLTAGVSLTLDTINIHYAYSASEYIENPSQHRISLSFEY
jgi:hypothetical protein